MHAHTFNYESESDFVLQMSDLIKKLATRRPDLSPYYEVRSRYPHVSNSAFTMRLKRFKGKFPNEKGEAGRKILRLFVTRELDEYLRK